MSDFPTPQLPPGQNQENALVRRAELKATIEKWFEVPSPITPIMAA